MSNSVLWLLQALVALPSVNPALDDSSSGEVAVADFIAARCRHAGLQVSRQSVFAGRDNVLVELRAGRAQTLLFEAHMDTVPAGNMPDAFAPTVRDGRVYGRGCCDTKGSLAAMLWALEQAAQSPEKLRCNIALLCAVDEEHGASGIKKWVESAPTLAGAVVGEPTSLRIVTAHKGCARFAVETRGRAAHSSVAHEGDSAITQMTAILEWLRDEIEPELKARSHPLCGGASLVVGTIRGGSQVNIVPDFCAIEIDRRVLPGEDAEQIIVEFERRLGEAMRGRGVQFAVRELLTDPPLDTASDAPVVKCAQAAARILGLDAEPCGVPFGSDASKLGQIGVDSLVFGPGSIAQAHGDNEYVPVNELETAAQFYLELMHNFGDSP